MCLCDLLQVGMVKGHQGAYKTGCGMRERYWYNDGDNMLENTDEGLSGNYRDDKIR